MSKIITPLSYSSPVGERGVFGDRTGKADPIVITANSISVFPSWEGQDNLLNRYAVRARLKNSKNTSSVTAFKYYPVGIQFSVSDIKPNIDWLLEIQLMELKTIKDKDNALAGKTPAVKKAGVVNAFKFRYATLQGRVNDKQIKDFVNQNIKNPAVISQAAIDFNISVEDIARATKFSANYVIDYFKNAGVRVPRTTSLGASQFTDEQINSFIKNNIGSPAQIALAANDYGIFVEDIARATGFTVLQVRDYFSKAGVKPPPNRDTQNFTDQQISDFINANLNDRDLLRKTALEFGISEAELARISGFPADQVSGYLQGLSLAPSADLKNPPSAFLQVIKPLAGAF